MSSPKSVDEMIIVLPETEQVMVKRLRRLVMDCLPLASEKAYYGLGVPFYSHHRMICFIWPASVFWGPGKGTKREKKKGVSLGFCQGNLMSNEDGGLVAEGRKQVYVKYFYSLGEIDDKEVSALLFEAAMIDDVFGEKRRRIRKHL